MSSPGIFPTFFLSGFECSTFNWKDRGRRDLSAELQHYEHADEDYRMLAELGIGVAREGIPWPLVDKGNGEYDFSLIDPFLDAQRRHCVLPIWDLCHYGYPDDLDPWSPTPSSPASPLTPAPPRLCGGARPPRPALLHPHQRADLLGLYGRRVGLVRAVRQDRRDRRRWTTQLATADIAAVKAIRADFPDARMVHIDPLIWVVPPRDRPDLADEAHREKLRRRLHRLGHHLGPQAARTRRQSRGHRYPRLQQLQLRPDGIFRRRQAQPAARAR
jgi:hypothetical protein